LGLERFRIFLAEFLKLRGLFGISLGNAFHNQFDPLFG
jgi:hypothetical protein